MKKRNQLLPMENFLLGLKKILLLVGGSIALNEFMTGHFFYGIGGLAICLAALIWLADIYVETTVEIDQSMPFLYRVFAKLSQGKLTKALYENRFIFYAIIVSTIAQSVTWFRGFLIRGIICIIIEFIISFALSYITEWITEHYEFHAEMQRRKQVIRKRRNMAKYGSRKRPKTK